MEVLLALGVEFLAAEVAEFALGEVALDIAETATPAILETAWPTAEGGVEAFGNAYIQNIAAPIVSSTVEKSVIGAASYPIGRGIKQNINAARDLLSSPEEQVEEMNTAAGDPATLPAGTNIATEPGDKSHSLGRGFLGKDVLMKIPFQCYLGGWKAESSGTYYVLNTYNDFMDRLTPYRFAEFQHLEAIVYPTRNAHTHAFDIDMAWTDARTANIPDGEVLKHPASVKISMPANSVNSQPIIFKCPLGAINPIVKDSIQYVDGPKLHIFVHMNGKADYEPFQMVLRGLVLVGNPSIW